MDTDFLDHYNRELDYLRELGGEFAQQYPAVAGRLGMDEFACADPFVERLLEGFAFLAARVHRRLDAEFPRFTGGLLETIYPHYTRPIPAAALVSLVPDADEGSLADGYRLPRGTRLHGPSSDQQPTPCRFDTTEDLDLWPIRLTSASLVARDVADGRSVPAAMLSPEIRSCLRLTIETTAGLPMSALSLDRLKLHFRGGEIAHKLHELVVAGGRFAAARGGEDDTWMTLGPDAIRGEGFADAEALLPDEPRSFSGYRLLQEYFLLPEKFLAASLSGLQPALRSATTRTLEIVIGLDAVDRDLVGRVGPEHFALHCVPAINLFKRRADRIQISDRQPEHHLLVDRSRPMDFEIWSVEQLHGHGETPQQEIEFLPLYAPPGRRQPGGVSGMRRYAAYYSLERRPRQPSLNQRQYGHRSNYLGSEVFVTLTDSQQQPFRHQVRQLSSSVYCTNRDLAMLAPASGWAKAFSLAGAGPVSEVQCLTGPTLPRRSLASADGETCWRLINHLTPNHLALGDSTPGNDRTGHEGAAMLRELLGLYCVADQPATSRQVDGVLSVSHKRVTRQLPFDGPIIHGRGIEVDLELDEAAFEGGGPFLLASVLEQFFARFVTLNSFTQLSLRTLARGKVHRWPVRTGTAELL